MVEQLDLSDSQRSEIHALVSGAREEASADHERMRELHESLQEQRKNFDADTAHKLADELGEIVARGAYRRASTGAEIYQKLTPEQQARFDSMLENYDQRRQHHKEKRQP